ncbi:MAG: hypothetical protein JXQ23_11800 [Clostridia bacterium]|nr:hypothetical protein [Clostridia bacterium]
MIDYNCLIGHWPFRKIRKQSLEELKLLYEKYEIEYGYISSLDSIFYHDPFEGDKELAEKLKKTENKMVISLNLSLPYIERDIKKANESFEYEGIRIYPSIHGFDLSGNSFDEFLHMVKENRKKLFISYRMGDIRLDHIIRQSLPDTKEIEEILKNRYENEIYVLNLKSFEVLEMKTSFTGGDKVYFDTSDVKHETFAIERFKNEGLKGKYVFGSFYPLYTFESTYMIYSRT